VKAYDFDLEERLTACITEEKTQECLAHSNAQEQAALVVNKLHEAEAAFRKKLNVMSEKNEKQRRALEELGKSGELKSQRIEELESELAMKAMEVAEAEAAKTAANTEREAEAANVAQVETHMAIKEAEIDNLKTKLDKYGQTISETLHGYDNMQADLERQSQCVSAGTQMTPQRVKNSRSEGELYEQMEETRIKLMESLDARQQSLDENTLLKEELDATKEQLLESQEKEAMVTAHNEKLLHDNKVLNDENASLMGHTNNKQKIQHVMQMKKENHELKKEAETRKSKMTQLSRKAKRCEEEMLKMAQKHNVKAYDFDLEERLTACITEEKKEAEKLGAMFERLAQEVCEVAQANTMVMPRGMEAGLVVPPQAVLDTCLSHLQDVSSKVVQKDKCLKDNKLQIHILYDKIKLLEQVSSVAA